MIRSFQRFAAVSVPCCALLAALASMALSSQVPPTQTFPDRYCFIEGGGGCLDCNAAAVPPNGCTAPPPANWSPGGCQPRPNSFCTEWNPYGCGVEITCAFSLPTGLNCNQAFILCR